jgi:FAD/FMN-containing dehydrogenase
VTDWGALQAAIAGDVVLPGSDGYERVRKPAIARFDHLRPQAVVLCAAPEDVAETISVARRSGVPIAVRSGGHCFAGRSSTRGVVIDVSPMRSVTVADGVATVGAGARLGDVYDSLDERGLTLVAGCGASVGIAGLTLGGGLGILGRRHGLTSDQLLAAQIVLAGGRVVECDDHRHEDLFWALRGAGGGSLGVVTSLAFRALPSPDATTFHLLWPYDGAAAVIEAWQAWAPDAPDELAASLLVTASQDVAEPPLVHVFGAMVAGEEDTAAQLDALVGEAGADPASAERRHLPYREAKRHLAEHGPGADQAGETTDEGHPFSKSEFFARPLPAEAVAALVRELGEGRVEGHARELDFTPWGGGYTRVRADATAFVHRDARFLLKHAAVVDPDAPAAGREAAQRWLRRSWATVHPWGTGGVYPNFPDPELEDPARAYHGANLERLRGVKARYDPTALFDLPGVPRPPSR